MNINLSAAVPSRTIWPNWKSCSPRLSHPSVRWTLWMRAALGRNSNLCSTPLPPKRLFLDCFSSGRLDQEATLKENPSWATGSAGVHSTHAWTQAAHQRPDPLHHCRGIMAFALVQRVCLRFRRRNSCFPLDGACSFASRAWPGLRCSCDDLRKHQDFRAAYLANAEAVEEALECFHARTRRQH